MITREIRGDVAVVRLDHGKVNAFDTELLQGFGVEPDIVVDNDPKSVIAGRDPQLERSVEELLRLIRDEPRRLPARPAPPVKTPVR